MFGNVGTINDIRRGKSKVRFFHISNLVWGPWRSCTSHQQSNYFERKRENKPLLFAERIDVGELKFGRMENQIWMIPSPLFPLRGMCPSCLVIRPSKWIIPPAPGGQILFMPLSLWIHLVETTGGVTVASKSKWGNFGLAVITINTSPESTSTNIVGTVEAEWALKKEQPNSVYPKDFTEAPDLPYYICLFTPGSRES